MTGLNTYNLSVQGVGPYDTSRSSSRSACASSSSVILNIGEENDTRDMIRYQSYRTGMPKMPRATQPDRLAEGNSGGFLAATPTCTP